MKLVSILVRKDNRSKNYSNDFDIFLREVFVQNGTHPSRTFQRRFMFAYSSPIFLISNTVNTLFLFAGFDGE